jgi:hypothetical protein
VGECRDALEAKVTVDPFASAQVGGGAAQAVADPFGQKPSEIKTSEFPSMDDLYAKLLVIQPTKIEKVPDTFSNEAGKMKERVTADVTVIDVENPKASTTHSDMYISQGALVGQVKGLIPTKGMLLGSLRRFPAKGSPDKTPQTGTPVTDPDSVDLLIAEWLAGGAKGSKPQFAWKLADFTETEKSVALEWYRSKTGQ